MRQEERQEAQETDMNLDSASGLLRINDQTFRITGEMQVPGWVTLKLKDGRLAQRLWLERLDGLQDTLSLSKQSTVMVQSPIRI